jgi:hypothetical protein
MILVGRRTLWLLGWLAAAVGCASLGLSGLPKAAHLKAPDVSIAGIRLAQAPSNKELASYYCAQHLSPLVCRAFGPVPAVSDLHFAFDVDLDFQNPNPVPLPVTQSLFAFTAFPQASGASNLGVVCVSFCEDPNHCAQDADACTSNDPEIRDIHDFAHAVGGLVFGLAEGSRQLADLRLRTIPPNERTRMVVRLGIDPIQMVGLIANLAKGDLDRIKRGKLPELVIPYRVEGTAWVSVESFGRFAANFGPADGRWHLH